MTQSKVGNVFVFLDGRAPFCRVSVVHFEILHKKCLDLATCYILGVGLRFFGLLVSGLRHVCFIYERWNEQEEGFVFLCKRCGVVLLRPWSPHEAPSSANGAPAHSFLWVIPQDGGLQALNYWSSNQYQGNHNSKNRMDSPNSPGATLLSRVTR